MQFYYTVTVPKRTPPDQPARTQLILTSGVLTQLTIHIPSGHAGLTGLRILVREQPIFPATPGAWFSGDDTLLVLPDAVELTPEEPYAWIEAYNLDETFPHTFHVILSVIPGDIYALQRDMREILALILQTLDTQNTHMLKIEKDLSDLAATLEKIRQVELPRLEDILSALGPPKP